MVACKNCRSTDIQISFSYDSPDIDERVPSYYCSCDGCYCVGPLEGSTEDAVKSWDEINKVDDKI